jgi:hypothetical protein
VAHDPAPLHPAALVWVPVASEQDSVMQTVVAVGKVHVIRLAALHAPPHVVVAPTHGERGAKGCPCATAVHLPNPGSANLQYSQAPVQAASQQTPSAQYPEMHCASAAHAIPSPTLPHDPPTQGAPTQSVSFPQPAAHARIAASHFRGAHEIAAGVTHAPALHCASPFSVLVTGSHDPGAHTVPFGQYAQLPPPSHLPVRPHVD